MTAVDHPVLVTAWLRRRLPAHALGSDSFERHARERRRAARGEALEAGGYAVDLEPWAAPGTA